MHLEGFGGDSDVEDEEWDDGGFEEGEEEEEDAYEEGMGSAGSAAHMWWPRGTAHAENVESGMSTTV